MTYKKFRETIWNYYRNHGRDLPWRMPTLQPNKNDELDHYRVFVSEVMLQQTQAPRVVNKYPPFVGRFPNFKRLAEASQREVLEEWQGLGYNRRGLNLKRAAEIITSDHRGRLPRDFDELKSLPGIGPATAASLLAFAYNEPVVFIETNVRSVYIHHFFPDRTDVADSELLPLVEKTLDEDNPREWYYAIMDYGSTLKKKAGNPSRNSTHHVKQSRFEGSNRQIRSHILQHILARPHADRDEIKKSLGYSFEDIEKNLSTMTAEGLLHESNGTYCVPD